MGELKVYLVDEGIYWSDYNPVDALVNYMNFCIKESGVYYPPIEEIYPIEVPLNETVEGLNTTLGEALFAFNEVGLLHIG